MFGDELHRNKSLVFVGMQRRTRSHFIAIIPITALLLLLTVREASAANPSRLKLFDVSQTVNGITLRVRAARMEGDQLRFNVCYPLPGAMAGEYRLRDVSLTTNGQSLMLADGWIDEWLYADGSRVLGWQMNSTMAQALVQVKGQPQSRCDWVAFNLHRAAGVDRAVLVAGALGMADGPQATTYQPANLGLDQVTTDYRAGPWRFDLSLK